MEYEINILVIETGRPPRPARVDGSPETCHRLSAENWRWAVSCPSGSCCSTTRTPAARDCRQIATIPL